jgi:hypothetical protein
MKLRPPRLAGFPLALMEWMGAVSDQVSTRTVDMTPGTLLANTTVEVTMTVPCSTDGQVVVVPPGFVAGILVGSARVTATNEVKVSFANLTAAPLAAPSGFYKVTVIRP